MVIRAVMRIVTFAYAAALPVIYTMWTINVLPEILELNFGYDYKHVPDGVSLFFSFYYYGIIVGCFVWPILGKYLAKRTSLMIGLIVTCFFNWRMGHEKHFLLVCFYRFLCGVMHNLNSVGKDFIFEFAHTPMHRQYGFSAKSALNVIALFVGPYAGYLLYYHYGKNFGAVCDIISILYLVGIVLFLFVFYLDYDVQKEIEMDLIVPGGEEAKKLVPKVTEEEKHSSMWEVLKKVFTNSYLRNLVTTYILNNGINKTTVIFVVMFSELAWNEGGLGISSGVFSLISLFSFIPSLLILLSAPLYVPQKFHYYTFIKFMIFLTSLSLFLVPFFRDIFNITSVHNWLVYISISIIFWANPKQFSPFINVLVNNEISKNDRTTINSILFLTEIGGAAIIIVIMAPIFRITMHTDYFMHMAPINKYIPFGILIIGLASSFILLNIKDYNQHAKKVGAEKKEADAKI